MLNHERIDFFLRDALRAAPLADIHDLSGCARKGEDRRGNKIVVKEDIGGLNEAQSFDSEEVGVSGTCADEINFSTGVDAAMETCTGQLSRGAGGRLADLTVRELVEKGFAGLAAWVCLKDFAAQLTEDFKGRANVFRQQVVDFTAKALCESGAFTGG
jgi:hypothetical protein